MSQVQTQLYQVKKISVIAKGADVLVREYVLGPGELIPWHHHTQVTDNYYNLDLPCSTVISGSKYVKDSFFFDSLWK